MAKDGTLESGGRGKHLCIGCGVCAGVCPAGKIEMVLGEGGSYQAVSAAQDCSEKCGLCERVCPFSHTEHNEDSIGKSLYAHQPGVGHNSQCGYYLSCQTGYCSDLEQRLNSASGGVATLFLKRLSADAAVDRAVCVTRSPGKAPLFRYSIVDNASDLDSAAKSAYYPVELSDVLREIIRSDARYAIVCLPCVAKAIRLAQMQIPSLRERIVSVLGLVCGHQVSSHFAEYAGELAGAPREAINEVVFRTKDASLPATELGTLVRWTNAEGGCSERTVLWSDGVGEAWSCHWFTSEPCFYCDDVFAECADVVFMDAWLPQYTKDYRGTSLVIVRSEDARNTLNSALAGGNLCSSDVDLDRVQESQNGVIASKRDRLAHRMWRAAKMRRAIPPKRVAPRKADNWYAAMLCDAEVERAAAGPSLWRQHKSLEEFQAAMRGINGELPRWIKARRFARGIVDRVRCGVGR